MAAAGRPPAKTFPFALDAWQQRAVEWIDNEQSVMVAAHTSAGKTSIAEYAIASALRDSHRVIYTSPIKALSNQKYRELQEEFGAGQVGLKTGDLSLNPDAPCLVMTTEILRNMLYRGAVEIQEVKWVIFDEIHYMRDRERGVVWEEAIILLPDQIRLVFLSATLANAEQFSNWVSELKNSPCQMVQTHVRPTPLHHYVFVSGEGEGIYLVSDPSAPFYPESFEMAISRARQSRVKSKDAGIGRLVRMLVDQNYFPAIIFSFSRRECEAQALKLNASLDMNTAEEKKLVQEVFDNALASLSEEDRTLPQALNLLPLLLKGIGVHHGGMLPILKEVVELLFQESLVKVLCATETFALGVNMPAKTVVFTALKKFDGQTRRSLSSGEYIQMSGRAGRRNRDPFGLCILMIDIEQDMESVKALVKEASDPLVSQFRLSYNSILNMARSELHNPDMLLSKSFHAFADKASREKVALEISELTKEADSLRASFPESASCTFDQVEQYMLMQEMVTSSRKELRAPLGTPSVAMPFMQPGRVVYIGPTSEPDSKESPGDFGLGVVIACRKLFVPDKFVIDVLVNCIVVDGVPRPSRNVVDQAHVIRVHLSTVQRITVIRVYLPEDLSSYTNRLLLMGLVRDLDAEGALVDLLFADFGMSETIMTEIQEHKKRLAKFEPMVLQHPVMSLPVSEREHILHLYSSYKELRDRIAKMEESVTDTSLSRFLIELKSRLRLLRRLNYVDNENVILPKGRLACEIDALDELVTTEIIVDGAFNDLDECETAALVSCLHTENERNAPAVPPSLVGPLTRIKETARRIATISNEVDLPMNVDAYVNQFSGGFAAIVLSWTKGTSFRDLCQNTTVFEGSIIRVLRRLQEVLVQLAEGAASIGNEDLQRKFEGARARLHRGIPFAGSLYL